MVEIPLWTLPLTSDDRRIFAWALEHFAPADRDGDSGEIMRAAIAYKSASVMVNGLNLEYLHNMACRACCCDVADVRFRAGTFVGVVERLQRCKPDAIRNEAGKAKQLAMFE